MKTAGISELINALPTDRGVARSYIGASGIGHECDANIAFASRGYPDTEISSTLSRIFREGHRLENQIVRDIRKAGYKVLDKDIETGKQFRYTHRDFPNHVMGNADGLIEVDGDLMLLEIKTMNDAMFKKFKKYGVQVSHKQYYAQCQMMMGLSYLDKAVLVAYCKNNSEYHDEVIEYDDAYYQYILTRIETVINNEARKISVDETDWRCRGCFKSDVCWQGVSPEKECASCEHAAISNNETRWYCIKHDKEAEDPCDDYEVYHPKPRL